MQRQSFRLHDERYGERVEIADAVIMRQPRLRAHAHRGRHTLLTTDRTQTVTAAQMTRNDPQIIASQQLARPLSDVAMARTMKAPALDVQLLGPLVWRRIVP